VTAPVYLSGLAYRLGEKVERYDRATGFEATSRAANMPDMPDVWGWGEYHSTDDAYAMGLASARATLAGAGVDPSQIDQTIFACSYFPDNDDTLYQSTGLILKELGLVRSLVEGQTLTGCATLLSAVLAAAFAVRSGRFRNVLVIAIDKLPRGVDRFFNYALFSDGAASCVVSSTATPGSLALVDGAQGIALDEIVGGVRFSPANPLHVNVLGQAMDRASWTIESISKIFNNNVYLPVKTVKDGMAGFGPDQMFLNNVARNGHCLACDSFINCADYATTMGTRAGERFVLQADGNGCCVALLVEASAPRASV
jgi:3-oxoacyl-[acyl-carrier-protein] synthase-3